MEKELKGVCRAESVDTDCIIRLHIQEGNAHAWKAAGVCVALGLFSVFIPLAHFVLVPAFLIAAPLAFFWKIKHQSVMLEITGTCPHCTERFSLDNEMFRFPIQVYCDRCRKPFKLEPSDGKAQASLAHL